MFLKNVELGSKYCRTEAAPTGVTQVSYLRCDCRLKRVTATGKYLLLELLLYASKTIYLVVGTASDAGIVLA